MVVVGRGCDSGSRGGGGGGCGAGSGGDGGGGGILIYSYSFFLVFFTSFMNCVWVVFFSFPNLHDLCVCL